LLEVPLNPIHQLINQSIIDEDKLSTCRKWPTYATDLYDIAEILLTMYLLFTHSHQKKIFESWPSVIDVFLDPCQNIAIITTCNPVSILEVRVGCSRITPITVLFFSHVTIVCGLWSCNTYQESWHKGFILVLCFVCFVCKITSHLNSLNIQIKPLEM
jgi:hypothetical protein